MEIDVEFQDYISYGTGDIELQSKTVVPTKSVQVVTADPDYTALSAVTVEEIPNEYIHIDDIVHPTLNAPTISLNANGGYLNVTDWKNGNFTEAYRLYLNGEETATFTSKTIVMTEYGISETDEITVEAVGNLFNNSPLSNMTKWDDLTEGTMGLKYSGKQWLGLGTVDTATVTDIYVASIVNETVITQVADHTVFVSHKTELTITLPDSITAIGQQFGVECENATVIFGTDVEKIGGRFFYNSKNSVLDFSKATKVPTVGKDVFVYSQCIAKVPDNLYDEWITATNWSGVASKIIRATDYEAQQGGSV